MDAIIRRNVEKAQQAKVYNQPQSTHYELSFDYSHITTAKGVPAAN
jgi:hypothetical protein